MPVSPSAPGRHRSHRADRVGAVVALKQLDLAKSRFVPLAPALRQRLALVMLVDTCAALAGAVDDVVLVTPAAGLGALLPPGVRVVADPGGGLNQAYAAGAAQLAVAGVDRAVAAVADLPCLRADDVTTVLAAAPDGRAFLPDHSGRGTTLLVGPTDALDPRFENGSARRHADSGARRLDLDLPGARLDIDELADLAAAATGLAGGRNLGSGTQAFWGAAGPAVHVAATVAATTDDGWTVVTTEGTRRTVPRAALAAELAGLRPTQRVHLALRDDAVSAVWV